MSFGRSEGHGFSHVRSLQGIRREAIHNYSQLARSNSLSLHRQGVVLGPEIEGSNYKEGYGEESSVWFERSWPSSGVLSQVDVSSSREGSLFTAIAPIFDVLLVFDGAKS